MCFFEIWFVEEYKNDLGNLEYFKEELVFFLEELVNDKVFRWVFFQLEDFLFS